MATAPDSECGSGSRDESSTSQSDLGGHGRSWQASATEDCESDFISWARRTENVVVRVHPGARDVLTGAVERQSATVTEAHAATEVVMLLDTLRMLEDQLYTVLMTLVEGESFDIFVGSGLGELLEA